MLNPEPWQRNTSYLNKINSAKEGKLTKITYRQKRKKGKELSIERLKMYIGNH